MWRLLQEVPIPLSRCPLSLKSINELGVALYKLDGHFKQKPPDHVDFFGYFDFFSVLEFCGTMSLMSTEFPYIRSFPRLSLFLIGPGKTHCSGLL